MRTQATLIRSTKKELKLFQKENHGWDGGFYKTLRHLSNDYRHHHIAYSLLKGTPYENIEKPSNEPDFSLIEEIKNAYTEKNVCASAE